MLKVTKREEQLLLTYQPDGFNGVRWLDDKLLEDGSVTLRRCFTFTKSDLISPVDGSSDEEERTFILGTRFNEYYTIAGDILGVKHDVLLDIGMNINTKTFVAHRDISIFRKIDELVDEAIVVGGDIENSIPLIDFDLLLKTFPTSTELTHYSRSRISRILKDYFGKISDAEGSLTRYLRRKKKLSPITNESLLSNFELQKFEYIHAELESMLEDSESYPEKDWQEKILDLLLLIFPKYIAVLENVHIKDFYSNPTRVTDRYIDLMLVDANGNTDIIEVKKPFPRALLSSHKYRDNHTPKKELAGSVMQAEKYLFHLSKWGRAGEQEIYKRRKAELPNNIELKITNPKAMLLIGRDNDFAGEQSFDFEIIRRKYANMLDVITYDDLLRRVSNIIEMINRKTDLNEAAND